MSKGKLKCVGSPLFLKKHYGLGYQLTVIKSTIQANSMHAGIESDTDKTGDVSDTLKAIVHEAVPSAKVLSSAGTEMSFQLPLGESAAFPSMLDKIDELTHSNQVEAYGVSVSTLDEVFLLVAKDGESPDELVEKEEEDTESPETMAANVDDADALSHLQYSIDEVDQGSPFQRHVQALFAKRAMNFKRDKKAWCVYSPLRYICLEFSSSTHFFYPTQVLLNYSPHNDYALWFHTSKFCFPNQSKLF